MVLDDWPNLNVWARSEGGSRIHPKRANIREVTILEKNLLGKSLRYHGWFGWFVLIWINDWGPAPPLAQSKFEDIQSGRQGTTENKIEMGTLVRQYKLKLPR